jgi:hypothetical protein
MYRITQTESKIERDINTYVQKDIERKKNI